jgi:hypothetical protein
MIIGWYWLKARELKERSLKAAERYCKDLSLKLLDESVVLKRIRLTRNAKGQPCLQRDYHFDFTSSGEDRYQGRIRLLGNAIDHIQLDPHRVQ